MSRLRHACILCALFLLIGTPALADQISIAVPMDSRPSAALLADLARTIARKAGMIPTVIQMRQSGIADALADGRVNAALAEPAAARSGNASNLGPVLQLKLVLLPRASTVLRSIRDLAGKKLAVSRTDASLITTARQLKATPLPAPDTGAAIKLTLAGQADAVLGWERAVLDQMQHNRYPARALGKTIVLASSAPCLLVSRKRPADRARLHDALTHLIRSGELNAEAEKRLK
ncbi:substrate-binding periplasmic protein [Pseudodesulfovibrio sp.]|uniref:substrate-binding periplasmic protein n=1 Tax=unclassified Pseudodesulfovibrio TaxID=2661612 RepID=UPI003AFF6269